MVVWLIFSHWLSWKQHARVASVWDSQCRGPWLKFPSDYHLNLLAPSSNPWQPLLIMLIWLQSVRIFNNLRFKLFVSVVCSASAIFCAIKVAEGKLEVIFPLIFFPFVFSDGRVSDNTKSLIGLLLMLDPQKRLTASGVLDFLRNTMTAWWVGPQFPDNFHANQVYHNDCAIAKFLNSLGKINGRKLCFQCDIPTPNLTLLLLLDLLLLLLFHPPPPPPSGRQTHYSRGRRGHLRGLGPRGRKSSVTLLRLRNIIIILNNFVFAYRQVFVEYYERARSSSSWYWWRLFRRHQGWIWEFVEVTATRAWTPFD